MVGGGLLNGFRTIRIDNGGWKLIVVIIEATKKERYLPGWVPRRKLLGGQPPKPPKLAALECQ